MFKLTFCFLGVFMLSACSSFKEKVVQTMEDRDRPSWATLSKTHFVKDGKVYFVGFSENTGSSRISAAMKISDNLARHEIARVVSNNMNFIYQNVEEGIENTGELSRFYGSEVSGYVAQDIFSEERFWEKVMVPREDGEKELRLRSYSLISIKQMELKKALREVLMKDKALSPELKAQIDTHMQKMVEKLGN